MWKGIAFLQAHSHRGKVLLGLKNVDNILVRLHIVLSIKDIILVKNYA